MLTSTPASQPATDAWSLVVNVHARSGKRMLEEAVAKLRERGVPLGSVHAVHEPRRLRAWVERALQQGVQRVLVGGGDGTVSAVAGALVGRDVELGVLPLGTGNDFARSLDIPFELDAAIDVLLDGETAAIDVGLAGNRPFLNAASIGLSAQLARKLHPTLKRLLGRLAYPIAALRQLRENPAFLVRLRSKDMEIQVSALQVVIGNGRYHGAGNLISPNASLVDARLHAYLIVPPGAELPKGLAAADPAQWQQVLMLARVARKLRSGTHLQDQNVFFLSAQELTLEAEPRQEVNVDGELFGKTPTTFSVLPRALKVRVPSSSHVTEQ